MADIQSYVYEGSEPYVFISYAHADRDRVMPLIHMMRARGLRVWYDAGIKAGLQWNKVIVRHLERSACVLCFLSPEYIRSDNCVQELYYAKKKKINVLVGYLEQFRLPSELDMELVLVHYVSMNECSGPGDFLEQLALSPLLESCGPVMEESVRQEENLWTRDGNPDAGGKEDIFEDGLETSHASEEPGEADFRQGSELFAREEYAEAMEYFLRAAGENHVRAICNLGFCYDRGRGVGMNPVEALNWYRKAAELGDVNAQFHVAFCHDRGRGTEADPAEAVKWYLQAASQGHVRAMGMLGACYALGKGVEADLEQSLYWYAEAAERGDADAQFNTGYCYDKGRGTEADPAMAVKWYAKAAAQEEPRALFNLGLCYETGRGIPKNPAVAVNCYTRAANREHRAAQYRLSLCYQDGVGVARDRRKADFWRKKSQEQ